MSGGEESVTLKGPRGHLRGVRHASSGADSGWTALVLHGYFSCTHIGPARLYVQLGRLLASRGVELWRVGTSGVGDSDGDFESATYESQLEDYEAVLAQLPEGRRLCLLGHSLGTSLALHLALRRRAVERLLLLSPSFGPVTWPQSLFTAQMLEELTHEGRIERKATWVHRGFWEALQRPDILEVARALAPRKLEAAVVRGARDEVWARDFTVRVVEALAGARLFELDGGDHNFQAPGARAALLALVGTVLEDWRSVSAR